MIHWRDPTRHQGSFGVPLASFETSWDKVQKMLTNITQGLRLRSTIVFNKLIYYTRYQDSQEKYMFKCKLLVLKRRM